MYQHKHTSLPLEELEGVPQALIVLLEALLEKDPGAALSKFGRPSEGDIDDNRTNRGWPKNRPRGLA